MGIVNRIIRLCRADIHGMMDHLEDKGLLLRQHLREMDEEIERTEAELRSMIAARDRVQKDRDRYDRECRKMEADVDSAIAKDKDDIARRLIKKLKPVATLRDELDRHIRVLESDVKEKQDLVDGRKMAYEDLKLRADEYFRAAEQKAGRESLVSAPGGRAAREATDDEIELELLRRKDALKGGAVS